MTLIRSPGRGVPASELQDRAARAHSLMDRQDLSALLLTTENEIRDYAGFQTPFWQSPTCSCFRVIPQPGWPVTAIPGKEAASMATT